MQGRGTPRQQAAIFSKEAAEKIKKAAKIVLQDGQWGGAGNPDNAPANQCITATLTSRLSTAKYAWKQQRRTAAGWEDVPNPLTDNSGKYPAYELDPTDSIDLSASDHTKHVLLARAVVNISGTKKPAWIIAGGAAEGGNLVSVPTGFSTIGVATHFGTVSVPVTLFYSSIPCGYSLSIYCSSGYVTGYLTPTAYCTVVTGASYQNVLQSAYYDSALHGVSGTTCVHGTSGCSGASGGG